MVTALNVQDRIRLIANRARQTRFVRQAFSAETQASKQDLFNVVRDLGTYPDWLDVVDSAEPAADDPNAWLVTLKARVGPFARSKRLRMVRIESEDSSVRFVRRELDGKEHSSWNLAATVLDPETESAASAVELVLEYDGAMWSGLLDGVLEAAAKRATAKLQDYVRP